MTATDLFGQCPYNEVWQVHRLLDAARGVYPAVSITVRPDAQAVGGVEMRAPVSRSNGPSIQRWPAVRGGQRGSGVLRMILPSTASRATKPSTEARMV